MSSDCKQRLLTPLANTSPTASNDTVRPPKIKLFVREDSELKPSSNVFGTEMELEPRRTVYADWAETFQLDLTTETQVVDLEPTAETQEWEKEKDRAWAYAVKVCLENMSERDRLEWIREERRAEDLERARLAWKLSATVADYFPSPDLYRGERWPTFHLAAHQPNWHVSYDYCTFYLPSTGCTDGECTERQRVALKNLKNPGTQEDRVKPINLKEQLIVPDDDEEMPALERLEDDQDMSDGARGIILKSKM
ncbi:hypothetical protein C8R45DRAFT_1101304 [Mycena sanguinolenta]|nr:hypothetical protein C8R45DRAFT_1101304 [Mycena sanguinolenta]